MDMKDYVLNEAGKLPSAHNDIVCVFNLERVFLGDLPAPRWGMRQRLRPAMIGRADQRVSRPCRNGHLGGAAASPDQSDQTSWNRESREPCETAQHRRCDLFVEGPKGHHASAPGPKARNVIGCQTTKISQGPKARNVIARPNGPGWQTTKIFQGLKGRPNIHAADGPALQAGRRWGGTGSRAFSPGYHIADFQPAGNELRNTVDACKHLPFISRHGNGNFWNFTVAKCF